MLGLALSLRESSTAFLKAAVWATMFIGGYCAWRGVCIGGGLFVYLFVWERGFVVGMGDEECDGRNVSEMAGLEGRLCGRVR